MASKIRLSVAVGDYEIIRALKEGSVEADGIELVVLTGHGPRERHWRMARNQEFDVCEFNVGAYLMSRDPSVRAPALAGGSYSGFRPAGALVDATGLPVGLHKGEPLAAIPVPHQGSGLVK